MDSSKADLIKSTFKIWAPDSSLWSRWAKPVLFSNFKGSFIIKPNPLAVKDITEYRSDTAIIVDMPGEKGVEEGLFLAGLGYRPVPLYNGVCETMANMVVRVRDIQTALFGGAEILKDLRIRDDAAPVFLLDSRRFDSQDKQYGKYDNRWRVFAQDMPSAAFLTKNGIGKVIVRTPLIDDDLIHILYRYKEAGLKIMICQGENIREAGISKPNKFKSLGYRFKTLFKSKRNTAGGFGANVGEMRSGGYYGGGFYGGYYGGMG